MERAQLVRLLGVGYWTLAGWESDHIEISGSATILLCLLLQERERL